MKKVGNHNSISGILAVSLALMLNFSFTSSAQEKPTTAAASTTSSAPVTTMPNPVAAADAAASPSKGGDPAQGKALFNANCAACHKLDAKATGPALRGVAEKHDMAWIYKWVHNSSEVIKSGDPVAVALFNEYNKAVMTAFPQLSTTDIDNIIAYTSEPKPVATKQAMPDGSNVEGATEGGVSNNLILGALVMVMAILVIMLYIVTRTFKRIAKNTAGAHY